MLPNRALALTQDGAVPIIGVSVVPAAYYMGGLAVSADGKLYVVWA